MFFTGDICDNDQLVDEGVDDEMRDDLFVMPNDESVCVNSISLHSVGWMIVMKKTRMRTYYYCAKKEIRD